jgi:rapamycin-insensitive companion of mTOR
MISLFNSRHRTLARDNKHAVEKEQVIKLVRAMIEIGSERRDAHSTAGSGTVPLSEPVMRAIIAVAEHAEDPFRPICVQTLAEIRECLPISSREV